PWSGVPLTLVMWKTSRFRGRRRPCRATCTWFVTSANPASGKGWGSTATLADAVLFARLGSSWLRRDAVTVSGPGCGGRMVRVRAVVAPEARSGTARVTTLPAGVPTTVKLVEAVRTKVPGGRVVVRVTPWEGLGPRLVAVKVKGAGKPAWTLLVGAAA